jgi:hypothetical protein
MELHLRCGQKCMYVFLLWFKIQLELPDSFNESFPQIRYEKKLSIGVDTAPRLKTDKQGTDRQADRHNLHIKKALFFLLSTEYPPQRAFLNNGMQVHMMCVSILKCNLSHQ